MTTISSLPVGVSLPRPPSPRLQPLRAGILNVWEYDDQEFWFDGGRLLLRGPNAAGKSKALELLLPFVLDGETRPERLDPFGSRAKTMYWNLIEFSERPSAIGYCWVEFGARDAQAAERFVTCIVGVRAVRSAGRRVDVWFAVTDRRVGLDLNLSPEGQPLTADRLRAALPEGTTHSNSAREHRAAVDHALFGLGPDRYDDLIHLLLQLRRPKLADKLDMTRLGEYLSEALPPLDQHRLAALATAFSRLDEEAAEVERLDASSTELASFLRPYADHARFQTRRRAEAVTRAMTAFDEVTKSERAHEVKRDAAAARLTEIEQRRSDLDINSGRVDGQIAGLDLSKVHALQQTEARASDREGHASVLRLTADATAAEAAQAALAANASRQRSTELLRIRTDCDERAIAAAEPAGLAREHRLHRDLLNREPDRAERALHGAAERRTALLRSVRTTGDIAQRARLRIERAEESARAAETVVDEAAAARDAAAASADEAHTALLDDVSAWRDRWGIAVSADQAASLAAAADGDAWPNAVNLLIGPRQRLADQLTSLTGERGQADRERDDCRTRLAAVEAEIDDAPPPRPGRPMERPDGCIPLWQCIDFEPDSSDADRAGLEAALEAAGLLDALVTTDGAVLDPATLDTWIVAEDDVSGSPLAGLVVADAVDAGPVERALSALRAAAVEIAADGSWRVGPLRGRWSKPSAEFIGAATRAAARARRAAALRDSIATLDARIGQLETAMARLRTEQARLDDADRDWPSGQQLRDARALLRQAESAYQGALTRQQQAGESLLRERAAGATALAAAEAAEDACGCRYADLDAAHTALSEYSMALVRLTAAARAETDARAQATTDQAHAEHTSASAATARVTSDEAQHAAAAARGEADELRRVAGAEAQQVTARHEELLAALAAIRDEQRSLMVERDRVRERLTEAITLLATTADQRVEAEQVRTGALTRFGELAATELLPLAMGPVDPELDISQVTAGKSFASLVTRRLADTDLGAGDAISNQFHNGFTTLRTRLGSDFNPYLDSTGELETGWATLNGAAVGIVELTAALDEQLRRRRETLTAEERQLIEHHLLNEIGAHLGERVHAAGVLTRRMNERLAAHATAGGITLRLSWEASPDAGGNADRMSRLLHSEDVRLLDQADRQSLAAFLGERVSMARDEAAGADMAERLSIALDYRRWHRFIIHRRTRNGEDRLTARSQGLGSGGEQAKLAHLPLFAATAAYYASARPDAPHLLMLDEAFAGMDEGQRADCLAMLVSLDIDVVLTNFSEWGCYPCVPGLAIYHLERDAATPGVAALRFVWNGAMRREDDPWLADRPVTDDNAGGLPFG